MEEARKKLFIECECKTCVLLVQSEVEYEEDDKGQRFSADASQQFFYLAIFRFGNSSSSWWYRLKLCWQVLTTGEPYEDQLVLSPDEAKKLAGFISENAMN